MTLIKSLNDLIGSQSFHRKQMKLWSVPEESYTFHLRINFVSVCPKIEEINRHTWDNIKIVKSYGIYLNSRSFMKASDDSYWIWLLRVLNRCGNNTDENNLRTKPNAVQFRLQVLLPLHKQDLWLAALLLSMASPRLWLSVSGLDRLTDTLLAQSTHTRE